MATRREGEALYRRWRPQRFSEVVGQEYTVQILRNAVAQGRLHHAYLFAGPRGTGKTSVARIFAKAVNCEAPQDGEPCNECPACRRITKGTALDVIEIDGASNRGIDQIRQLREEVNFVPAETRYKVYIIDEVHMLTNEAFNALLKTLEEPPRRVIFIFATTEPHKVPPTVVSRCQAFEFKNIPTELIEGKLREICAAEGIKASERALQLIARRAKGSLRDAEVLLEQLSSYKGGEEIVEEDLLQVLGLPPEELVVQFLRGLLSGEPREALAAVAAVSERGKDLELFLESAVELGRDLALARLGQGQDETQPLPELGVDFELPRLLRLTGRLMALKRELRGSLDKRITLEVGLLGLLADAGAVGKPSPSSTASRNSSTTPAKGKEPASGAKPAPESKLEPESEPQSQPEVAPEEARWKELLEEIKHERVAVYALLAEGRPVLEEGRLRIEYPPEYEFHKKTLERQENLAFLREKARRFYGDLQVEVAFSAGEEATQAKPASPKKPSRASREELERKAELVRRKFHGKRLNGPPA